MQIQINTDHNIEGRELLTAHISTVVEHAMSHIHDHVTRVEVHVSDENGDKDGANDMRCVMEARLEGRQPVAVTHQASTVDEAVHGAAEKLARIVEGTVERLRDQKSHRTDPPLTSTEPS